MNPGSLVNPYLNSDNLTDEQKQRLLMQARGGIPGMPSGLITQAAMNAAPNALPTLPGPPQSPASIAAQQQASMLEAPWQKQAALPPLSYGTLPGAPPTPSSIVAAGAPGAPVVAPPVITAARPASGPKPASPWLSMLLGAMGGGGIGGQTGMGLGMGAGIGLGALAGWLKNRREKQIWDEKNPAPPATPMATGGVVRAQPKPKPRPQKPLATVVRMAAGGAAKQRHGYPRTTAPRKLTNPFKGIARGGGKATRGMNFKSS